MMHEGKSIDNLVEMVERAEKSVTVSPLELVTLSDEDFDDPADRDDYRDDEGTFGDRYQDHIDNGVTPGDFA